MIVRGRTDSVEASKEKEVILLGAKNYDVFVEYKTLHEERKHNLRSE